MSSPDAQHGSPADRADPESNSELSQNDMDEKQGGTLAERPSKVKWILTCLGLYLGALLYGLDTTIAADVQASVYEDLGDIEILPWVGIGFPMGSVAIILLVGKLYSTFEIKKLFIAFTTLFEVGSAVCGAAPTSTALIIGRVLAGCGGAGMYIGALSYISIFTNLRERSLYNALIGLAWGIGAILGPVIGGAFSDSSASWRWAFYINLPLAAALAPVYLFVFPQYSPAPELSVLTKIGQLDWAGAVLNAATFVLFMVTLTLSGPTLAWSSGGAIALWVVFGVVIVAYALQQTFCIFTTPEQRLFPVHFLKRRTFVLMFIATSAVASATAVAIYFVPLFFQFTKGDSAIEAAVRLLPFITIYVFSVMFSGALLPVVSRYTVWYYPSGILVLIGGVLMFRVTASTSTAAIYGFEVLLAVGTGLTFQVAYAVLATKSEPKDVGSSIGFINVSQIGSISLGLSIAGNIFQNLGYNKLSDALSGYGFSETELRNALAGAASQITSQGGAKIAEIVIREVVATISQIYALVIAAGAVILVCAVGMRWEKLKLVPAAGG